jgi:hypothetical protein
MFKSFIEKLMFFLLIIKFNQFRIIKGIKVNEQTEINKPFNFECFIHNQEYGYEFLYHSNDTLSESKSNVYTYQMEHVAKLDRIRWHIVPKSILISSKKHPIIETVYLKAYNSNKYLCASTRHVDRFKLRRRIYLMSKLDDKSCEWRLDSIKSDYGNNDKNSEKMIIVSRITNLKYKEGLYAASNFFKKDRYNRHVYLWHDKNEASKCKKFNWIIDCIEIQSKL